MTKSMRVKPYGVDLFQAVSFSPHSALDGKCEKRREELKKGSEKEDLVIGTDEDIISLTDNQVPGHSKIWGICLDISSWAEYRLMHFRICHSRK
jgi:hypothetical protein